MFVQTSFQRRYCTQTRWWFVDTCNTNSDRGIQGRFDQTFTRETHCNIGTATPAPWRVWSTISEPCNTLGSFGKAPQPIIVEAGYGNLVWRHSPDAQNCDLAWQQRRKEEYVNPKWNTMSYWVHESWWNFVVFSHDDERLVAAMSWGCGGLPPRSFLVFSQFVRKFVVKSARIFTVTAFFGIKVKRVSRVIFISQLHGRSCKEVCGKILRIGKQNNSTVTQSCNSMHWRPSLQRGRNGICWRIFYWSVNNQARAVTKWTTARDTRLVRLISYIHHICEYRQQCHVGNTAKQCRFRLFQDSDFVGDLEDSKSTSGGTLCIFGSHTFVPISWMCKKQTSVSHSSTIKNHFLGRRIEVGRFSRAWFMGSDRHSSYGNTYQSNQERWDPCTNWVRAKPHKLPLRKKSHGMIDDLNNVDFISSNVHSSRQEALLYIFEDNEAVINMITKGRSPTMRHVSRTRRVALGWLLDRINLDPNIEIKFIDTKNQLADILTKGNFTRDEWNHLLCLFNNSYFSSTNCLEVMSKRKQEDAGEERVTAKSMPMMNLVSRCRVRDPTVLTSTASESPEKTKSESQNVPLSSWNEQQPRTVRLVMGASSSDHSEWNIDDKVVFSRLEKSGEMLGARTGRPVSEQQFTQKADKFVIDDRRRICAHEAVKDVTLQDATESTRTEWNAEEQGDRQGFDQEEHMKHHNQDKARERERERRQEGGEGSRRERRWEYARDAL